MKILIVDDKKENRYLLETMLKGNGYNVVSAANGKEALEKLCSEKFDLIISDILMPVMDGYQLCTEVKKDPDLQSVPFIFYTATYTDAHDEELAYKLGAERYIRKPAEPDEFIRIIRELLRETEGKRVKSRKTEPEEKETMKLYNERLVSKLEKKMLDLENSEKKYRILCENINDMIFSLDKAYCFTMANCQIQLFGYEMEDVVGKPVTDIITPASRERIRDYIKKSQDKNMKDLFEIELLRKDGGTAIAELNISSQFRDDEFAGWFGVVRDITRRKQAEEEFIESEKRYRTVFEGAVEGILIADIATKKFIYANHAVCALLGYSREELLKLSVADIHPEDSLAQVLSEFKAQAEEKKSIAYEIPCLRKDGDIVFADIKTSKMVIDDKACNVGFFTEVTERMAAEKRIQQNLQEKEILLRELYHRTKNNMQVISAMLRLRARSVKSRHLSDAFKEIENKIMSMALVHQRLYESEDLSQLNLKDYIHDLIALIKRSYGDFMTNITVRTQMKDANVLIDTAVPIGLVVNELLANAVKHAFPEGRRGTIHVKLDTDPQNRLVLEISDNGVGLPNGFDFKKDSRLGLQTVSDLAESQLDGKIKFTDRNGLHCRLTLSKELYQPRV